LVTQQTRKISEIGEINNKIKSNFDPQQQFDTSKTYSILELEQRLNYIRTFTRINYDELSQAAKTELKRVRRGQVYENTDIVDSKTLFEASEKFLLENINPSITVDIESISILQAYEAQSDWDKVRIGEKVDIFVPDLKIIIEAEVVEISIDFQNYKTALKIATTRNYDRRFGKYFADLYGSFQTTYRNTIVTTKKNNEKSFNFITLNEKPLVDSITNDNTTIGDATGDGLSNGNERSPNSLVFGEVYIHPVTEILVSEPFVNQDSEGNDFSIYGDIARGSVKLTNGGIYIKDENNNLRVKLTSRDGLVAQQFKIDLEGNATFAGNLQAAGGTFSGDLSAAGGTFSGDLSAAGGTFAGNLQAAGGTFSGDLSAAGGTFAGDLSAAGGTFSGNLSAAGGTFSGDLQAADGSFGSITVEPTGSITVGNIVISNSGIIATNGVTPNPPQTFNLNATNGDLTITGGLSAASSVQFSDVNVSINQSTYGYEQPGIFLGVIEQDGLKERFSIVGPGINPNYLK
jgi:cytoskeletal protein CcmA (bactofilin family)